MVTKLIGTALLLWLGITLSACSVKMESEWFGKTEKDDRSISKALYPEGVTQQRKSEQRY